MKKTPSKSNNQFGFDFACPGLCSRCHTEIAEFEGSINGYPKLKKWLNNAYKAIVVLNDNSKMTVMLCEDCYNEFGVDDCQQLMESEINGMQEQVDRVCTHWKASFKKSYMKYFSDLHIKKRHDQEWRESDLSNIKKPRTEKLRVKAGN